MLPRSLDPRDLPAELAGFSHWFRYSLHARDFHPLREAKSRSLRGYYTAKPLYAKLDARGRVDRSSGFDGRIAGVFVPSPARSWRQAKLFLTNMPKDEVGRPDGTRNWTAINGAAERALRKMIGKRS